MPKNNLKKINKKYIRLKNFNNSIEDLLKNENLVMVKHPKVNSQIFSIIKEFGNDCLYIKKPKEFSKSRVRVNDELLLNLVNDSIEYIFICKIIRNSSKDKYLMKVEILKIFKYENRRRSKRFFVNFQGNIDLDNIKVYGIIKNISKNGLSILLRNEIDISRKEILNITVLTGENDSIEFNVRVIRIMVNGVFNEYGLDIVDIKESDKSIFEQLLLKLEKDQLKYVEEYLS
jgi:hypothetical protein